jgi:hypothetical protein
VRSPAKLPSHWLKFRTASSVSRAIVRPVEESLARRHISFASAGRERGHARLSEPAPPIPPTRRAMRDRLRSTSRVCGPWDVSPSYRDEDPQNSRRGDRRRETSKTAEAKARILIGSLRNVPFPNPCRSEFFHNFWKPCLSRTFMRCR